MSCTVRRTTHHCTAQTVRTSDPARIFLRPSSLVSCENSAYPATSAGTYLVAKGLLELPACGRAAAGRGIMPCPWSLIRPPAADTSPASTHPSSSGERLTRRCESPCLLLFRAQPGDQRRSLITMWTDISAHPCASFQVSLAWHIAGSEFPDTNASSSLRLIGCSPSPRNFRPRASDLTAQPRLDAGRPN